MPIQVAIDYRMHRSSGIGVYLRHIVRNLVADHRDSLELTLLGGSPVEGAQFRKFPSPIFSAEEQVRFPFVVPERTEILWSPNYNAPFISRGQLVVTVHDVCHLAHPEFFRSHLKAAYARVSFRNVARRAAAIICDSEFTVTEIERLVGIPRDRMRVIYPGLDFGWSPGSRPPRPHDAPYLLYVGNVKPHKNLGRLLAAFSTLAAKIPHSLVIVGRKDGLGTLDHEAMAIAQRFGDRVVVTGEITDEALQAYYANADLLVFPSLYEGFGFPPLEAMASGVPVAASRAASIPEVCGDGATYFDPLSVEEMAAVIEKALSDETLRAQLRDNGRRQIVQYSWQKTSNAIAEVFAELGAARRSTGFR
jgi:glycosyltransferase involved in cell wall biosynthesis